MTPLTQHVVDQGPPYSVFAARPKEEANPHVYMRTQAESTCAQVAREATSHPPEYKIS